MESYESEFDWGTPFLRSRDSFLLLNPLWQHKNSMSDNDDIATVLTKLKALTTNEHNLKGSLKKEKLIHYMPDLLRISSTATNSQTKQIAFKLMKLLSGYFADLPSPDVIYKSPSGFIALDHFPFLTLPFEDFHSSDEQTHIYLLSRFEQYGRIENFLQVMALHPEFLDTFTVLHSFILESDSLMPYVERYYIAILAAAEMRCLYLVYLFARQFIIFGGDNKWLFQPLNAPPKLQQLVSINTLLAHEPWKLSPSNIASLTLNISEITFVIGLITHIHALSCFVFGSGVRPEIDHPGGCTYTLIETSSPKRFDTLSNGSRKVSPNDFFNANEFVQKLLPFGSDDPQDDLEIDRTQELFKRVIKDNDDLDKRSPPEWIENLDSVLDELDSHPVLHQFLALNNKLNNGYNSFIGTPFHFQTFPWDNDAQAEMNQLYEELGSYIGENFNKAFTLTYHTVNEVHNVDTSVYRRTVWNTVQSFFGICHDDFDYERVDIFVTEMQRIFLKRCSTRPYEIANQFDQYAYETIMPAFKPSEVVHVMLMMMEARRQACLLYAIRAISDYRLKSF